MSKNTRLDILLEDLKKERESEIKKRESAITRIAEIEVIVAALLNVEVRTEGEGINALIPEAGSLASVGRNLTDNGVGKDG
jgi:hypothetical protein